MTQHLIQWLTPAVQHFYMVGYWVAFLAALAETVIGVGLLLPGSTLILLLGALSARGFMDLGDLLWFAVMGAIIGDNINYHLGKKFGARWTSQGIWFLKKEHFEKATAFFERHGAKSVFWGRFIPSVKEMVPFIAGLAGMRQSTFMVWNILGGIGWGLQWVLPGYLFAQSLYLAKMWLTRMSFIIVLGLALVLIIYFIRWTILKYGRDALTMAHSVAASLKAALVASPKVAKWIEGHQPLIGFLSRRLDAQHFSGLPLTLLGLAFIYILILFGGIVEDFLTNDPIVAADIRLNNLIVTFRTPHLVKFFLWVTVLGKWQVVTAFAAAAAVILWMRRRRAEVAAFMVTLVGSQAFTHLSKLAFHRARPAFPVYVESSYSFPSGHSAVAMALYGFLAYLLIHQTAGWKAKVNFFLATVLIVFIIGFSRLYLGVHYLSDVWSGYLIGALWLVIGITLSKYWEARFSKDTRPKPAHRGPRVLAGLVTGAALVFYVGLAASYHPRPWRQPQTPAHITISAPQEVFHSEGLTYTESLIGEKELPINLVVLAPSEGALLKVFDNSGWVRADAIGLGSLAKDVQAVIFGPAYGVAPLRPLFWNAEVNDFGFERPVDLKNSQVRRAVRLWTTSFVTQDGREVYLGQASLVFDLVSEPIHEFSLDVDSQRDFLCRNLAMDPSASGSREIKLGPPFSGQDLWGNPFVTDGQACLIELSTGNK